MHTSTCGGAHYNVRTYIPMCVSTQADDGDDSDDSAGAHGRKRKQAPRGRRGKHRIRGQQGGEKQSGGFFAGLL